MAATRWLEPEDRLPLTCSRRGTCCHGKDIRITPWELALLAQARGVAPAVFREAATDDAGTRLRCDGPAGWQGLPACAMYDAAGGCSVHASRPLACRLYPLGRALDRGRERFFHEGRRLPCLDGGCPEVVDLPMLRVREYLGQQGIAPFTAVRDDYLEVAQDLAEGAFVLVFDSGLDRVGGADWRRAWRAAAQGGPAAWRSALSPEWHDLVTAPGIAVREDGRGWCAAHRELLRGRAQAGFAILREPVALSEASARMLGGALLLIHGVGGDATEVGRRWLRRAGC